MFAVFINLAVTFVIVAFVVFGIAAAHGPPDD